MSKSNSDFAVGDCMWAKIGSYPYWPCIITNSPGTQTCQKPAKKGSLVHVHFFGDNGKHSWVSSSALMSFKGLDEFNKLKFKTGDTTKPQPGFNVKSNLKSAWDAAVKEIENVVNKDITKRLEAYYSLYPLKVTSNSGGTSKRKSVSSDEEPAVAVKVVKSAPPKKAIKAAVVLLEPLQNGVDEDIDESESSKPVDVPKPESVPGKSKKAEPVKKEPKRKADQRKVVEPVQPQLDLTKINESLQTLIHNKKQFTLAKSLIEKVTKLAVDHLLTDKIDVK